jgi:hypothetical protein
MTENGSNSNSDKSHQPRRAHIIGPAIIRRFFIFVIKPPLPRARKTGAQNIRNRLITLSF